MRFDNLKIQVLEIQDQVKQAAKESKQPAVTTVQTIRDEIAAGNQVAKEAVENTTRSFEDNISSFQNTMIETLRAELAVVKKLVLNVRDQLGRGLNQP